jgi:hypothetical protein
MNCPRCANVNLTMSERAGVEIDYCPTCRGVWLDRGELDKILERSVAPQSGNGRNEELRDHHSDSHHDKQGQYGGPHGRRSWLRDIFD